MKCKATVCDRPVQILRFGLCKSHYYQMRAGKELAPIKKRGNTKASKPGYKTCTSCLTEKPVDDFYKRAKSEQPQSKCKECAKKAQKAYSAANKKETGKV